MAAGRLVERGSYAKVINMGSINDVTGSINETQKRLSQPPTRQIATDGGGGELCKVSCTISQVKTRC